MESWWITLDGGVVAVLCLALIWVIHRRSRKNAQISEELRKLPANFSGKGNVVFGPNGIWTVKSKNCKGDITQPPKKFLAEAREEAEAARNLIKEKLNILIKVQPVLVFSNSKADVKYRFYKIEEVYVVQKNWLSKLISEISVEYLNQETQEKIKGVIST
jgi:hypothetical protein